MIQIEKPIGFQGIGRKDNQEDSYVMSSDGRFFVLCDGMGGHENGEMASQTVCEALNYYFTKTPPENYEITKEYFDNAVKFAYEKLDEKDKNPDSIRKMGTTLTCVYFGDNQALVAHIGDSRVYQIRPSDYTEDNFKNAVKIETKDHSLVQQLIDIEEITEEEAKTHPKRNIITKCMQPHDDYDMPDYDVAEVKEGDYFFLCSDGILENVTTEILCKILSEDISDEQKKDKLFSLCDGKTRDNFTCLLIHVKNKNSEEHVINAIEEQKAELILEDKTEIEKETELKSESESDSEPKSNSNSISNWLNQNLTQILICVAAIILSCFVVSEIKSCSKQPKKDPISTIKKDDKPKKETELEKLRKKYQNYDKTHKNFGMILYSNPQTGELVLVNENSNKEICLITKDTNLSVKLQGKDSIYNYKKISKDDLKIFDFCYDSIKRDTTAEIELILQKKTKNSSDKTKKLKINSELKFWSEN